MKPTGIFSPLRVLLFFALLATPAFVVAPTLQVALEPGVPAQRLQVSVSLNGAAPLTVERQVVAPLENALSGLRGLKAIASESHQDYGFIDLTFGVKEDLAARRFEIATLLRSIFPKLPPGTAYPQISGFENGGALAASAPQLWYTVQGSGTIAEVRAAAELFFAQTLLATTTGVALSYEGGQEAVTVVEYLPQALEQYGLTPADLTRVIQQHFYPRYCGVVRADSTQQLFVRLKPPAVTASGLAALKLLTPSNLWVGLDQLAQVRTYWEDPNSYFRINGQNAIGVGIQLPAGGNKIYLATRIQQLVARAAAQQRHLRIRLEQDQTVLLRQELRKNWLRTGASLLILLSLLLLSYRQWRMLAVLMTCLGVNLALTLMGTWLWGVTWHTYSLAGVSVAFGLLLDNGIVVLDAYRRGTNLHIFPALIGATATTIGALCLVFLLPLEYQTNLRDFALVTILSLLSSLLSVFFLVPAAYALWLGPSSQASPSSPRALAFARQRRAWRRWQVYRHWLQFCKRWQGLLLLGCLLLFGLPIFLLPTELANPPGFLRWINAPVFQQVIRPQLSYWLGGTLQRFIDNLGESSIYRSPERSSIYVEAELPVGHVPAQLNELFRSFEAFLQQQAGIELFKTRVYSGTYGALEILFDPALEGSSFPLRLQTKLEGFVKQFSGVQWQIRGQGQSFNNNLYFTNQVNFRLILKGYDHAELLRQAEKTGQLLRENMRVQQVKVDEDLGYFGRPFPQFFLQFSADRLADRGSGDLGVWIEAIRQRASPTVLYIPAPEGYQQVVVRSQGAESFSTDDLLNEPLKPQALPGVKIKELGQLEWRQATGTIYRENRQYLCLVTFEYLGNSDAALDLRRRVIAQIQREMPLGYAIAADSGNPLTAVKQPFLMLLILLGLNYFIGAVLFESWVQPLIILVTVPIAMIGVWSGFAASEFVFDQGGLAALVLLSGLVVNAAIFMVHDLNRLKRKPIAHNYALIKMVRRRAPTILLTVATTICGFVPFLWEGPLVPFWFALAFGTISGLVFSLLAIFWVLPVLLWQKEPPRLRYPSGTLLDRFKFRIIRLNRLRAGRKCPKN